MILTFLYTAILVGIGALVLTLFLIPKLTSVSHFKKLMNQPNERSSHGGLTPNLGGIAFYIAIMLAFYFIAPFDKSNIIISLIPGLTIIFLIGLKDDLVVLAPLRKLSGQFVAAAFLVLHYRFAIESFHGFLGIEFINIYVAKFVAIFIVIAVMNAINLIDGIDGLAASISLIVFSVYGFIFYYIGKEFLVLVCITMVGTLIGFLFYNLNKKTKKKTFMGDTGSMILGLLIGALSVRLLAMDTTSLEILHLNGYNVPVVIVGILFVPLFDTGRVFLIRILKRKNPFKPDRNHIHHIITDRLRISHRRASFCIGCVHFVVASILIFLALYTTQVQLLLIFATLILIAVLFLYFLNKINYYSHEN